MAIPVQTLPCPPKPASKSTTIIAAGVTVAFSLLGLAGIAYTAEDVARWTDIAIQVAPLIVTLAGGIGAWIGRRNAKSPIEGGPADPVRLAQEKIRADLHG